MDHDVTRNIENNISKMTSQSTGKTTKAPLIQVLDET